LSNFLILGKVGFGDHQLKLLLEKKISRILSCINVIFLVLFLSQNGNAQVTSMSEPTKGSGKLKKSEWFAKIKRPEEMGMRIPGLAISVVDVPLFLINKTNEVRSLAVIPYDLELPNGAKLFINDKTEIPIPKNREQRNFYVYLTGKTNTFKVTLLVGADRYSETIVVEAPQAQEYQVAVPWDAVRIGLSSVFLAYRQTGHTDFFSWNGQIAVNIHTPEKVGQLGASLDVDSTVFTAKATADYYPQLLTGRADLIYPFAFQSSPTKTYYLGLGVAYSNLSSNGAPFGYRSLLSPELTFKMRYLINKKSDYFGSLSLAPLKSDLKDYALQFEVSKSFLLKNLHRSEFGFRVFDLNHHPDEDNAVRMITYALFLTYSI
jgi:hypothetical protein